MTNWVKTVSGVASPAQDTMLVIGAGRRKRRRLLTSVTKMKNKVACTPYGPFHYEWNALPMSYTGNLAPIGNRTQAKCFKRIHLTTIPSALISHHELIRACSLPGFETRTSCTQSRNHTTRPNGQRRTSHVYCNYIHLQFIWILHFYPSIPKDWCTHSGAKEARWVELEVELKLEGSTASNRPGPNRLLITSDQETPNDKQKTPTILFAVIMSIMMHILSSLWVPLYWQ